MIGSLVGRLFRAQLGQTRDPRELVPGNPAELHDVSRSFEAHAAVLEEVATRLNRIDVPGWQGRASAAFLEALAAERPKWLQASDALVAGASAIREHAQVLSSAQQRAQEAIQLWDGAEAATAQARAQYEATVPPQPDLGVGGVPPFVDPGAEGRRQAEQIVSDARAQVEESGSRAAQVLARESGRDGGASGWLAKVVDVADTAMREHGVANTSLTFGPDGNFSDWKVDLGKAELLDLSVWDWGVEGATDLGPLDLSGSADVAALGVDGTAEFSLSGKDGLKGELSGSAYLLKADAEGAAEWGIAEVGANAEVFVGAEAGVDASIGRDGLNLGGEAFAGARAEVAGHADVGGVGVGANAEGWAGAGIEGDITVGKNDDGSWTVGAEGGAALGFGGKLGFEVTVDPPKVIDTAVSAADAVGDFAGSAVDTAGDFVSSIPTPW